VIRIRHGMVRASLAVVMLLAGLLVGVPTGRAAEQACFQETGQCIDEPFLTYWQEHGGLAVNGLPLTGAFTEQLGLGDTGRYTVQYFERVRLELHPENPAPYDVLLGQFGRRIVNASDPNAILPYTVSDRRGSFYRNKRDTRVRLGLPTSAERTEAGVFQEFEGGYMFYRTDTRTIIVYKYDAQFTGNWVGFKDTWVEGQDSGGGRAPAQDRFFPRRGFGKVWRDNPAVQQLLGYAMTPEETVMPLVIQSFAGGLLIDMLEPRKNPYRPVPFIYIFYTTQRFESRYQ